MSWPGAAACGCGRGPARIIGCTDSSCLMFGAEKSIRATLRSLPEGVTRALRHLCVGGWPHSCHATSERETDNEVWRIGLAVQVGPPVRRRDSPDCQAGLQGDRAD